MFKSIIIVIQVLYLYVLGEFRNRKVHNNLWQSISKVNNLELKPTLQNL